MQGEGSAEEEEEEDEYTQAMLQELRGSKVLEGFTKRSDIMADGASFNARPKKSGHDEDEEEDLDLDLNLVSNFLESFASQEVGVEFAAMFR